jgi:uncharacterized protein (TIRG00374 family)
MAARTLLRVVAGVALSAAALVLLAQVADIPAALRLIAGVAPGTLVLPVLVVVAQFVVRSVRWALLLSAMGPARLRAADTVGPLAVGYLGNTVLPARLGEVVRIVVVARRTPTTATAATASVVVERAVDLLALLAIAAAAAGLVGPTGWAPFLVVLLLLVAVGAVLPVAARIADRLPHAIPARAHDIADRLLRALAAAHPPVVARAWLLSLVAWSGDALVMWLCARALGVDLPIGVAALLGAGAAIATVIPAAGGYLGTYELGAMAMAAFAGVPSDQVLGVILLAHAVAVVPLALMGIVAGARMLVIPGNPSQDPLRVEMVGVVPPDPAA